MGSDHSMMVVPCIRASWWSFGTAQRRDDLPATLSKALCRPCLVYPLASLDVSGQWPVSRAAPRLRRASSY